MLIADMYHQIPLDHICGFNFRTYSNDSTLCLNINLLLEENKAFVLELAPIRNENL